MTYRVVHINTSSGGGEVVQQQSLTAGGGQNLVTSAAPGAEVAPQMAYIPSGSTAGDPLTTISATGSGQCCRSPSCRR